MADRKQEQLENLQNTFVEEVDFNEITNAEIIGAGAYGKVYKALWRNKYVAVKFIVQQNERNAFAIEVRQLSRVSHPNIVALYGACTKSPNVCLVMEYAEGGSLYNVLHCHPKPVYTAAHAMSWARQCAEGVAYLHAMRPKPLIHRDLKPPNLLLVDQGRILKICDFGTVADKSTLMTNNKGSAAWMAPEVFEGRNYTEKCDVFSWGIILWEVLSREQPFKDIKVSLGIMWSVHNGHRPPLIEGCPKPIENLMTSCWDRNPTNRPSMDHVVKIMTALCDFFPGADEPLDYNNIIEEPEYDEDEEVEEEVEDDTTSGTDQSDGWQQISRTTTINTSHVPLNFDETKFYQNPDLTLFNQNQCCSKISTIPEENEARWASPEEGLSEPRIVATAPVSLENKSESTIRNGILKTGNTILGPLKLGIDPDAWAIDPTEHLAEILETLPKSQGKEQLTVTETKATLPEEPLPVSTTPDPEEPGEGKEADEADDSTESSEPSLDLETMHLMLDEELRPGTPDPNNQLSQEIFQEHKDLAKEYLKIQTEIAYVTKHREELLAKMDPIQRQERLDLCQKLVEKEDLLELHSYLKHQLELIKSTRRQTSTDRMAQSQLEGRTRPSGGGGDGNDGGLDQNDEGWVYIPSNNQ